MWQINFKTCCFSPWRPPFSDPRHLPWGNDVCVVRVTKLWSQFSAFFVAGRIGGRLKIATHTQVRINPAQDRFSADFVAISVVQKSKVFLHRPFERWPIPASGQKGRRGLAGTFRQREVRLRGRLLTSSGAQATPLPLSAPELSSSLPQRFRRDSSSSGILGLSRETF